MIISDLWIRNFRSYESAHFEFSPGLNAFIGPNGIGKTNLVEALSVLSTQKSHRGSPTQNLIRRGTDIGVLRAKGIRDDRDVLIELEVAKGKTKAFVNKQPLKRAKDLLGALQVTVFAPDDLALIKFGPSNRRDYLDDLVIALDPSQAGTYATFEKSLKQRNSLLKQINTAKDESVEATLDVWDKRVGEAGTTVRNLRQGLLARLRPISSLAYAELAGERRDVTFDYESTWEDDLVETLVINRTNDIRRSVTTTGPHRDDLVITLDGFDTRNEASQGEQRSLALSLRLAGHKLLTEALGEAPLLLLDDVLSELDMDRATALLNSLGDTQTIITSAVELPEIVTPDAEFREFASNDEFYG